MKPIKKVFLLVLFFASFISNAQATEEKTTATEAKATELRYYYYPNIEAYFDLQEKTYLYKDKGEWVEAAELPKNYGGYSLYNKVKVNITDYDGDEPYLLIDAHKKKFPYNAKGRFAAEGQTAASE